MGGVVVDSGTTTGRVYVGERSHELHHAFAYAPPGGEELWVYLTDVPLSENEISARFGAHAAARADRVHGVQLTLDPRDTRPTRLEAVLLMPPKSDDAGLSSISAFGSVCRFERLMLRPGPIEGRVRFDQEAIFESLPYGFEAEFRIAENASVAREEPTTLTGADAQACPQAEAFLAGEAAMLAGDLDTASRYMASERIAGMRRFMERASPKEFEDMLEARRKSTPEGEQRRQQICQVVVEGDEAILSTTSGERVSMRKTDGSWVTR